MTSKPKIQIVLEQEYYEKFMALAAQEQRTASNMGAKVIRAFIDSYENENGAINVQKQD